MAINYTISNRLSIVHGFLQDYHQWYEAILEKSFYGVGDKIESPNELSSWLETVDIDAINIDGRYSIQKEEMLTRHAKLMEAGNTLSHNPTREEFTAFSKLYQQYFSECHNLAQAIILENWGLDILTGLKNNAVMKKDLKIEMERLSREGYPFCIGLARIDDFAQIEKNMPPEQVDALIKTTSNFVKGCLRNYDDAYRVSRDHFIMCLKQSDIMGGQKALERLRDLLEGASEVYSVNGEQRPLSLSCCVASPFPGDEIEDLIDNLYVDLDKQIRDHGAVLTYQELSPLQRFMRGDEE